MVRPRHPSKEIEAAVQYAEARGWRDECSPVSRGGVVTVHFDRAAESQGDAVGSAIRDVERAGLAVAAVTLECEVGG